MDIAIHAAIYVALAAVCVWAIRLATIGLYSKEFAKYQRLLELFSVLVVAIVIAVASNI